MKNNKFLVSVNSVFLSFAIGERHLFVLCKEKDLSLFVSNKSLDEKRGVMGIGHFPVCFETFILDNRS